MESLIIHCNTIFDEQLPTAPYTSSPPLPPAPLGETTPSYAYGSTHTKFSEYGSQQQFDVPFSQTPTPQTTGDDFTPRLPPRPPPSIHPSSRGNTGNSNGHSNTSPTLTDSEPNVTSPISYIPPTPLPLRPGRQSEGTPTPIQTLRGTKGLDFSQPDISEGDWIGPPPASPPLSDPPSPPPSAFKPPQIPPPPSPLPYTAFVHKQQQPILTQLLTQEQAQAKAQPPLPAVETIGSELIATPFDAPLSSMVDDGHSSHLTCDPPRGPTLQPATLRPVTRRVSQVPAQVTEAPDHYQQSLIHPLRHPGEVPQGVRGPQDEAPPSELY